MHMTQAEAERRYDAERNGAIYAKPIDLRAQIDAETDPTMRKRLILRLADQVLGVYAATPVPWQDVKTPIATIDDVTVYGTHDTDGTPNCAYLSTDDGYFYVGSDGVLSGEWAGMNLEIRPEQLLALRSLFTSNLLSTLQNIAQLWAGNGESPKLPEPRNTHLRIGFSILALLQQACASRMTEESLFQLQLTIATLVDTELGIVDFVELPALEARDPEAAASAA